MHATKRFYNACTSKSSRRPLLHVGVDRRLDERVDCRLAWHGMKRILLLHPSVIRLRVSTRLHFEDVHCPLLLHSEVHGLGSVDRDVFLFVSGESIQQGTNVSSTLILPSHLDRHNNIAHKSKGIPEEALRVP